MALPDLTDIRTEVRNRMGLSTSDTAVTDAILTTLINSAERYISLVHDWPWLVATDATLTATVAGQFSYTPAADWRKTMHLFLDGDQPLNPKQPQDIRRYNGSGETGHPAFYAVEGQSILVAPIPDAVYTLDHVYLTQTVALSGDTDEPLVPMWALDLLITYTCVLVARRLRDPAMVGQFTQEYAMTLDVMKDEVRGTRQLPVPRHRNDIGWP